MKLENVLKNFGDEKLEIKKFTVNADKKEKIEESANKKILFDFKDKLTKYMLMPFQVFNEVFIPKDSVDYKTGDDSNDNDRESNEIMKKCSRKKNKRKCIKKAIRKTCRRKGNMRKMCKKTMKKKLLN